MKSYIKYQLFRISFIKHIFFLSLFISFYFSSAIYVKAEENPVTLEEIVVTPVKMDETKEETTSSVTIITSEDIKKMNLHFITDVLKKVPELNLVQNGGIGTVSTVLLRGGDSTQTLVMIDGVKVNSTTTGSFDFSGISVEDIERIEIVKGPQSTIYGSEAMAGVINIITKKGGGKRRTSISFEGGSWGTYNQSLTVSGSYKKVDYRLTGNYYYTDGISAAKQGKERDGYGNSSISGKLNIRPSEIFEIETTSRYYYDRAELDGFEFIQMKAVDDLNFVQRGNHYLLACKGKIYLFDIWEQLITFSTTKDTLKFKDPDTDFNNYEILTKVDTIDWQHNFYISDFYTLIGGFEYRKEKGENKGNYERDLYNKAFYINNKLKIVKDALIFNAGLRHDEHETFGDKTTYRIGAVYNVKPVSLKIRSSYGTGYRAPTFNELFFPSYGDPELKPEESTSWEIGLEKDVIKDKLSFSVTYFKQEYKNLIQTDPLTFTAANIAKAEVKGVEVNALLKIIENLSIQSGYTYLDTEDKATGQRLTRRPQNKFNLSGELSLKDISIVANYTFMDERFDSSVQRNLSAYQIVNLAGSYRAKSWMTLFMRINNLLDEDYEEIGSYGTYGFSVFGGIRINI